MSHDIQLSNVGPIEKMAFRLQDHGVTVLVGPNGVGKSQALGALQKAMLGKGKLPLRDGQRRGSVEAPGVVISIGQTTRYNGEFEITNLESRMPLADLVDPQMKSPEAADRHRIKALVALTGVTATRDMFANHDALKDFAEVVTEDACRTDDLVEMAARVKRDYEAKAREAEKDADREEGHVRGLEDAANGLDLEAESDADQLQAEYDAARDAHSKLAAELEEWERVKDAAENAKRDHAFLLESYKGKAPSVASLDVSQAAARIADQDVVITTIQQQIETLQQQLDQERGKQRELTIRHDAARSERDRAVEHANAVAALEKTIAEFTGETPETTTTFVAAAAVERARAAQELGVKIRDATAKLVQAEAHKDAAAAARKRADHLRSAAGSVDEVLSDAIQCDVLKVDIQDGAARLVVDHPQRGEKTHYHELSMGERWCIAIGIGADRVGEGGLLVVEQDAWESLDAFVRPLIHQHAMERKVFVLTAEATRDPDDGTEMQAKPFEAEVSDVA